MVNFNAQITLSKNLHLILYFNYILIYHIILFNFIDDDRFLVELETFMFFCLYKLFNIT